MMARWFMQKNGLHQVSHDKGRKIKIIDSLEYEKEHDSRY